MGLGLMKWLGLSLGNLQQREGRGVYQAGVDVATVVAVHGSSDAMRVLVDGLAVRILV